MRTTAIAALLLFAATSPGAITWEFEEDTQGWQVRLMSNYSSFFPPLDVAVEEGVLRIPVTEQFLGQARYPVLISPKLDLDSGLFDRVEVRLRFVHSDPVATRLFLSWINDDNEHVLEFDSHLILSGLSASAVFTSEWQEMVFHPLSSVEQWVEAEQRYVEVEWGGNVQEIRLTVDLFEETEEHPEPLDLSELPEWVEIDRIVLTGVEERLQGELPPPEVSATNTPGLLFEPARFVSMGQEGLGFTSNELFPPSGMADLDGDGDLDVLVPWGQSDPYRGGFVAAMNDGSGALGEVRRPVPDSAIDLQPYFYLGGLADANGDGRVDLFYWYDGLGVWLTDDEALGGYTRETIPGTRPDDDSNGDGVHDGFPKYIDDFDGDGDIDLLVFVYRWTTTGDSFLRLLLNDGAGRYSLGESWDLPQHWAGTVRDFDGDGKLDTQWFPTESQSQSRMVMSLSSNILKAGTEQTSEMVVEAAGDRDWTGPFAYGDFNGDGAFDMIFPGRRSSMSNLDFRGLLIAENDGTHRYFELVPWQDEEIVYRSIHGMDLNGDGLLDLAIANRNDRTGRNVIIYLGRENGFPVEEGRYGLGGNGNAVWAGDLDADGDLDLVVIDGQYRGGGLHVLYNRLDPATAVEWASVAVPEDHALGQAYPNPFNPDVVIPLTLAEDQRQVTVRVYNSLGQEVRRLAQGPLAAGHHSLSWDGRDGGGQPVASGSYLLKVSAGDWEGARKVVKTR